MQSAEYELLEKFRLLDKDAQERVRALIEQEIGSDAPQAKASAFDYDAWFHDVETLRNDMQHGGVDVVSLLRDIRDGVDE